jgi:predicted alternative tryptophan synthase beta-subunit
MAPQVSLLKDRGVIEAVAVPQSRTFEASRTFTRAEAILPAPEPTHAISVVIDEAKKAKEAGTSPVILFNLCGHGHFDVSSYERYLAGDLEDYELPQERIEHALETVPSV